MKFTVVRIDEVKSSLRGIKMKRGPGVNAPLEQLPNVVKEVREVWLQCSFESYRPGGPQPPKVLLDHEGSAATAVKAAFHTLILDERYFPAAPQLGEVFELLSPAGEQ